MCNPVSTAWPEALLAKGEHLGFEWEVTQNRIAYRCGYVRIPPGHPWHGLHYDHDDLRTIDGEWVDVHGGLTFSEPDTHCDKGGPDDAWWLGFDCAHAGDAPDPALEGYNERCDMTRTHPETFRHDTIKSTDYVRNECLGLIRQAAEVLDGATSVASAIVRASDKQTSNASADGINAQGATT